MPAPAISQFLSLPALLRLLRRYGVDARYRKRARSRILFSLLTEPFRWYERLRYGWQIRATQIHESPVYLLGFGRSGTTHLHYLFWQDPQFGVVSNYLANLYPVALMGRGWLERFFANKVPGKRPMDNVAITLDAPQEEELALINATADAPLHFMSFPRELPGIYDRWVSNLGSNAQDLATWKRWYLELLAKATILSSGKRLVLKTPTNTGRVRVLSELFPNAKFVHIVRNPYRVLPSMRNMYHKILPAQVFQEFKWEEIDAWTVEAYRSMMTKYLEERKHIPASNLVEIRYEDLDERPLDMLREMYSKLELGDFEMVRPRFEAYLESLGVFEKNVFEYPDEVIETVNQHWGFALEAFGYERLVPGQSVD